MKISFEKMIVYIFSHKTYIHCGYKLEPPRPGGSNEYPQCMFWGKNKRIGILLL